MSTGVYETHVGHSMVVSDGVGTLTIIAVGTIAGASTARSELRVWSKLRVSHNLMLILGVKSRWNVVLSGVTLCLPVDARKVDMRGLQIGSNMSLLGIDTRKINMRGLGRTERVWLSRIGRDVLLEPKPRGQIMVNVIGKAFSEVMLVSKVVFCHLNFMW